MRLLPLVFLLTTALPAQWDLQPSHTTASLRGIHALGHGVAWASGTEGTVLRTIDDGLSWRRCSTPPAAEHLDFRGIQAFDANTALVMSSGKGDLSRLYKTTDGCQSWKLVFTNPDKDGFWDAITFLEGDTLILVGDPTRGGDKDPFRLGTFLFDLRVSFDRGEKWAPISDPSAYLDGGRGLHPLPGESMFAASNSSVASTSGYLVLATNRSRMLSKRITKTSFLPAGCASQFDPYSLGCGIPWVDLKSSLVPMASTNDSSGIFSLAFGVGRALVAVGGDYQKPNNDLHTAAYASSVDKPWHAAQTPPHGYRSAVAYSPEAKAWITVGPNGTDLSTDDGRNWRALKPGLAEPPDADRNWNALSLPFVVGPQGRIGHLRPDALPKPTK